MFRDRAIFLLVISAILIALIFITTELILVGIFIVLFILTNAIFTYLFYREKETGLEQWYAFWTAIAGLIFMLILILVGKRVFTEFLGLLLFLAYFIGLVIFLFRKQIMVFFEKPKKRIPKEEDFETFRKKDELQELVDFFEPKAKPGAEIVGIEEPKIDKIIVEEAEKEKKVKKKVKKEKEEDWLKHLPKSIIFDYEEGKPKEEPKIRELKEAPRIDFEKVRQDLEKIDTDVKTISEKIKLISERAILEGAEKKIKEIEKKKLPKPKKSRMKVYASKTGNKYHFDKNCLGLKRVSKKNLVIYANSAEARKKKLKACGMCK